MNKKDFSRMKKMQLNSISAIFFLFLNFISGFILPKLIITYFGSATNGLVNSINQFLQVFTFLEMGMGVVIISSLYVPIAQNDDGQRDKVVLSGTLFYQKIGFILTIYVFFLALFYPRIVGSSNDRIHIVIMILAISADMFGRYYFGMVDRCVLTAYQKEYIYNIIQSILLIITTIVSIVLIISGISIEIIKVVAGVIMIASPVTIRIYLNKNYHINRKIKYTEEPIKQKWNGVAQHISYVVCQSTDAVVLTFFSTLENVSVYAIYNFVSNGLSSIINALFSGAKALMGDLCAQNENEKLKEFFCFFEWMAHNCCVFIFSCSTLLIVDFVKVYTRNVFDANYIQPLFGFIFMLSKTIFCLEIPYIMLIQAYGHYKQTQNGYIISAGINVGVSILLVRNLGLVGIAIGTFIAMLYQTVFLVQYCYKKLFNIPFKSVAHLVISDVICFSMILFAGGWIGIDVVNYFTWGIKALMCMGIAAVILVVINYIIFPGYIKKVFVKLKKDIRIMD